jgi:ribonuclease T2
MQSTPARRASSPIARLAPAMLIVIVRILRYRYRMDHRSRSRMPWRTVVGALVLVFTALGVQARHHQPRSDGEAGVFDYYVLSLSWAPTYCLTHTEDGAECSGKGYGLVLHGLWPQYESGGYPERCDSQFQLSSEAASKGTTIYPSEQLMRHEWQEHGTCSGLDPLNYFSTADRATAVVKVPKALDSPPREQILTPSQIVDFFKGANHQMSGDAMTLACNRGGLSEVRICLTKDLALRSCGRGVHTSCPTAPVRLPASR